MQTDPLPSVSTDDPYYWDEKWPELDTALEDYDDDRWDREVELQWNTR